jgi:hypothetical protein
MAPVVAKPSASAAAAASIVFRIEVLLVGLFAVTPQRFWGGTVASFFLWQAN